MTDVDELLTIGRFARLSGLSIGALRHYHEVGLLEPAVVDAATSYRSYARSQLEDARLIGRLRELDIAIPGIRAILGADLDERRRLLASHRSRLQALEARLQRQVHWLNRTIDHEESLMSTPAPSAPTDLDDHRQLAVDLFNHVWTLIETPDRTPMQDDEMIHAAHASRYHWGEVGKPQNLARSLPCGTRGGASPCAKNMGSETGTSRSRGRPSLARLPLTATARPSRRRSVGPASSAH